MMARPDGIEAESRFSSFPLTDLCGAKRLQGLGLEKSVSWIASPRCIFCKKFKFHLAWRRTIRPQHRERRSQRCVTLPVGRVGTEIADDVSNCRRVDRQRMELGARMGLGNES